MNRKVLLGILTAVFLILAGGCILQYRKAEEQKSCTKQLFAMDTVMSFTAYGKNCEQAVDAALQEIQRLDELLSTGNESSELSRINQSGCGTVSEDTAQILTEALDIYESTGGLFDVSIYPLMDLWGFPSGEYHVATEEELAQLLPLVNASEIQFDGTQVTLGEGQKIDFGGIAKGYASGRVMEIFRDYGIKSAMVTLGGNIQVLNEKTDGTAWQIGIQDPAGLQGSVLAVVQVRNKAVVTSGGYERYFEEDGKTYIHILDPRTGYPVENGLTSVSIISENGMLADALSTSLFIMGLDDAVTYWEEHRDSFDMVLITEDGKLYITEGIAEDFRTEQEVEILQ
jgi:thiamine biosynthesis lipoprotein